MLPCSPVPGVELYYADQETFVIVDLSVLFPWFGIELTPYTAEQFALRVRNLAVEVAATTTVELVEDTAAEEGE